MQCKRGCPLPPPALWGKRNDTRPQRAPSNRMQDLGKGCTSVTTTWCLPIAECWHFGARPVCSGLLEKEKTVEPWKVLLIMGTCIPFPSPPLPYPVSLFGKLFSLSALGIIKCSEWRTKGLVRQQVRASEQDVPPRKGAPAGYLNACLSSITTARFIFRNTPLSLGGYLRLATNRPGECLG